MSGKTPRRRYRREPAAAADMLGRYRPRGRTGPGAELRALCEVWPEVAGAAVATNSMPLRRTRAGVLTIACSGSSWAHELSMHRDRLLESLRRATQVEVVDLRFVVAEHALVGVATSDSGPATAKPPEPPNHDEQTRARQLVEGVTDPDLSDLLVRAAAIAVKRASTGR